jgi:hypothetical protein
MRIVVDTNVFVSILIRPGDNFVALGGTHKRIMRNLIARNSSPWFEAVAAGALTGAGERCSNRFNAENGERDLGGKNAAHPTARRVRGFSSIRRGGGFGTVAGVG